jgi:3-keto-5-aminohexanoate cleavage enzyme
MTNKAVITCSLTGVLTDPKQHPVPVTVKEMADSARDAYNAGASCMHVHFRKQEAGKGHMPSWEPEVACAIADAIRNVCPGVILNFSTGVPGRNQEGPMACLRASRPEIAAMNSGSLNYLKTRSNGTWAWPPMLFDNPVEKIIEMLDCMKETGTRPEFECFDVGIVRSVNMFQEVGMVDKADYNFVMGVASGMPADPDLLELLVKYMKPGSKWQTTVIGRDEIWPVHRKTAELGGNLRTGVEDTFYLPDGSKTTGNGQLIEALAQVARDAGREIASPKEARELFL